MGWGIPTPFYPYNFIMLTLTELQEIFGVEVLVKLSNDDPNADPTNPSNINTTLMNHLLTEMEGRYGGLLLQYPYAKYLIYRLVILELHRRREQMGSFLMEENLRKEYEEILSHLNALKFVYWRVNYGKSEE